MIHAPFTLILVRFADRFVHFASLACPILLDRTSVFP